MKRIERVRKNDTVTKTIFVPKIAQKNTVMKTFKRQGVRKDKAYNGFFVISLLSFLFSSNLLVLFLPNL